MKKEKIEEPLFIEGEIWKDINGYAGLYQVSDLGRVKSLARKFSTSEHILSTRLRGGYFGVTLCKNSVTKDFSIHILVAREFIENPNNYNIIHHIDNNKLNNKKTNLMWCTQSFNIQTAYNEGSKKGYKKPQIGVENTSSKKILQLDLQGNFIREWDSAYYAVKELGFKSAKVINKCCRGELKTAYGFIWKYIT